MERNDLIERLRQLLNDEEADFESDLIAAAETGERIDLDTRELEVPVDWLNQLLDTIAAQAATISRLEAEVEAGWQPIETAPKDGSEFVAYREDQGAFACRWMTAEEVAPKNRDGDPIGDYTEGYAGWWHDVWGWLEGEEAPTLWHSFPAPPRTEGERV